MASPLIRDTLSKTISSPGWILRISEDLLQLYADSTGIPPVTLPITMQDITPYGSDVYHVNSILQPSVATSAPVVGVAITTETAVPGCGTGATNPLVVEGTVRFCIEVAKAFGAAVPADSIDPDYGMIVAVQTMVGDSMIFKVICIAFLITLFANMAAWSFGVNSVARYAAEHGNMPKVFASMISDDDMPNGANLVNAIVASLVLCLQLVPIDAISNGVFWMLFGTSVVFLLLTYIPMFPAFLNLRKNDPNRERIFTFPFKGAMMKVMLAIPCIELILAIVATLVPLSAAEIGDKLPMIVIFIVLVLIGEVVRVVSAKGRETEYKGLTPELAAQRLAEEAAEAEEN